MENLFLSLEKEVFRGNVLDITYNGQGIIYLVNKYYDNSIEIDYLDNDIDKIVNNTKGYYDSCVMFFSLRKYKTNFTRKRFLKKIHSMMSDDGYLYIWDIKKDLFKTWTKNIKVVLPDKTITELKINEINLLEENSPEKVINSIEDYFNVIESVNSKDYFKIVAKRKGV